MKAHRSSILLALIVAVALLLTWEMAHKPVREEGQVTQLSVPADCNPVAAPCQAGSSRTGKVTFSLGPPVKALVAFPIHLAVAGVDPPETVQEVTVAFSMPRMDMGVSRYRLLPQGEGKWSGTATLGICASGRRDWVAQVRVAAGRRVLKATFPFALSP